MALVTALTPFVGSGTSEDDPFRPYIVHTYRVGSWTWECSTPNGQPDPEWGLFYGEVDDADIAALTSDPNVCVLE